MKAAGSATRSLHPSTALRALIWREAGGAAGTACSSASTGLLLGRGRDVLVFLGGIALKLVLHVAVVLGLDEFDNAVLAADVAADAGE